MATANTIISSGTFPEPAFREHVRQFDTNSDNILLGKNIDNSSIKGFDNKGEPVNLVSYNPDKRLAVFDAEPSIVVYSYNIGHEEDCFALNVWNNSRDMSALKHVMVWIHTRIYALSAETRKILRCSGSLRVQRWYRCWQLCRRGKYS